MSCLDKQEVVLLEPEVSELCEPDCYTWVAGDADLHQCIVETDLCVDQPGLVDTLRQAYVGVRHALGAERFDRLLCEYLASIAQLPVNDATELVARFPAYLCDCTSDLSHCSFLVQLALLEHAEYELWCEFGDKPAHTEPADASEPAVAPTVRLMSFDYPVHDYLQTVESILEEGAEEIVPAPHHRQSCWVAVYRRPDAVGRTKLGRRQFHLLDALIRGKTLDQAIRLVDTDTDERAEIQQWLQQWSAKGFLRTVA